MIKGDYRKVKQMMANDLDKMVKDMSDEGIDLNALYYFIAQKYGFGHLTIDKCLEDMKNIGLIEITSGIITKVKVKKDDETNNDNDK